MNMSKDMAKLAKMMGYSVSYHSNDDEGCTYGKHYNRENLSINLFKYIKNSPFKGSWYIATALAYLELSEGARRDDIDNYAYELLGRMFNPRLGYGRPRATVTRRVKTSFFGKCAHSKQGKITDDLTNLIICKDGLTYKNQNN